MIWEHNVTIIVMLTKLKEMGREKCAQYWPIDQSIRYGYFIIEPMGEYHMSQYLLSEFKLTDTRVKKIDLIYIFNNLNVLFLRMVNLERFDIFFIQNGPNKVYRKLEKDLLIS